jgi:large subunit ribosomal protein L30
MTEKKTVRKGAARKAAASKSAAMLRITLLRSPIGETYRHKATIRALGLRQIRQTVEQPDTPQLRGMLSKVNHLVAVEAGAGKEKSS